MKHTWTIIGESCHKYRFCRNKHVFIATNMFVVTKRVFCHNKNMLVTTNICHDKRFVAHIILLQERFGRGKHTFVATKDVFFVTNTCVCLIFPSEFLVRFPEENHLQQSCTILLTS